MARRTSTLGLALAMFLAVFGALVAYSVVGPQLFQVEKPSKPTTTPSEPSMVATCPDTKQTTVSITLRNAEDETQADTFDATGYIYEVDENGKENYITSITDTTAGTVTLDCGKTFILRLVSADGNKGDNSRIWAVESGKGAEILSDTGAVKFTTTGASYTLRVVGSRHGVLEFRAKDRINDAFMYDSSDASNTDWELDGVTFTSTTDNSTATAVGTGGRFEVTLYYRTNETTTQFNDQGYLIMIDAATSKWEKPKVILDGVELVDQKGSVTPYESRAFADYEYIYIVPAPTNKDSKYAVRDVEHELKLNFKALDGVDPGASDDIQVDFAARGAYLSIDGQTVKYGAAKDDSSTTVVFTVQDVTFDIS